MSGHYDAIVIGAGPAGQHCAGRLADGGMRVGIVERERVGGECDYWACIPSKMLLRPGEALEGARHAPGAAQAVSCGVRPEGAFDWRDFMVSAYEDIAKAEYLESKGIGVLRGGAQLAGAGRVVSNCLPGTFSSSACLARSRLSARAVVAGEWHRALDRSRWPAS